MTGPVASRDGPVEDMMFERIVRGSPDALTWHHADGTIAYASDAFRELFGYEAKDLVGEHLAAFAHPDDRHHVEQGHHRLRTRGVRFCTAYRLRGADALYVWVESRSSHIGDDPRPGYVVATRDVHNRQSLLAALQAQSARFEMGDHRRDWVDAFLTTVAHATRTPMTSILGFATTLRDRRQQLDNAVSGHLIERLAAAAEELAAILERATTMRELSSTGPGAPEGVVCAMGDAVRSVLPRVAAPDAPLTVDVDDSVMVAAPLDGVEQVVDQLLRNTIMHTLVGTHIWVTVEREGDRGVLTVADAGPGVPDDQKAVIFEPFRSAGSRSDYNPGIGLGLSIVAGIARRHGGHAELVDRPGGGAAFRVHLPLATSDPTDTPPR